MLSEETHPRRTVHTDRKKKKRDAKRGGKSVREREDETIVLEIYRKEKIIFTKQVFFLFA